MALELLRVRDLLMKDRGDHRLQGSSEGPLRPVDERQTEPVSVSQASGRRLRPDKGGANELPLTSPSVAGATAKHAFCCH